MSVRRLFFWCLSEVIEAEYVFSTALKLVPLEVMVSVFFPDLNANFPSLTCSV